ncbi:MAG: response regulator transcription factor [Chloroflexi bacterium]|nr:response regulator transcription factor [Chloroflexota bacterium]
MGLQTKTRVIVVDDHAMVRSGLIMALEGYADVQVVGEAGNGVDAVHLCEVLKPDVVLMDLRMPRMDGVSATRFIHQTMPNIRIVILTSFTEPDLVQEAMAAGAVGFLLKDASLDDLASAVHAAYEGKSTVSPDTLRALVDATAGTVECIVGLTDAERRVLELLFQGVKGPEITERMQISTADLDVYINSILSKLSASSRS